jgi:uncharacterized protein
LTKIIPINKSKNGLTFDILLTPHASQNEIASVQDNALKVKVTALPVEGAANEACLKLLAKKLGLKKNQFEIFVGSKSRKKVVLIKDISKEELEKKLHLIL